MKALLVGNWKLYVSSLKDGKKLLAGIDKKFPRGSKAEVVVCPPVAIATLLRREYKGRRIAFGSQDASSQSEGAHTGDISPRSLAESGIEYVILGHSERRASGETNEIVAKKVAAALQEKLKPIVCISEIERDQNGAYMNTLKKDLTESLSRVESSQAKLLTIAYEPAWAIGGEETLAPRAIAETVVFIRKTLAELWGRDTAFKTRIIYGAAVNSGNVPMLVKEAKIEGALVGHHSVDAKSFTDIIRAFS